MCILTQFDFIVAYDGEKEHMYAECSQKVYNAGGNWAWLGGDTGETGGELAGIVWEEMGWMGVGVQGAEGCRGRAAGPAAEPSTRAKPVCFDAVETACGRWGRKALPCMGKRISKTPKRPRSDVP